ncbi:MAG: hypothetical protein ABW001_14835 [Mycobacterium sp.]
MSLGSARRARIFAMAGALAIFASMVTNPALARAAPGDDGTNTVAPALPLTELGANSTISFYGQQGVETMAIPIPPGLLPAELTAVVENPGNLRSGMLTVTQDDRTISRVRLPDGDTSPIAIPLAGVDVADNSATLVLRSYLTPSDGYCFDPTNPLRLSNTAIRFDGAETPPAAVADFLPPVLRKLTIFIPAKPLLIESEGAVRMATAVAARYGKQNPQVEVVPLLEGQTDPPQPSMPMERQIVIREGPETAVGLRGAAGVPWLLISGQPDQLVNQTRLLSSNVSRLAISSKAVVGPLKSTPQLPADVTTIRKLGQPGVNATALSPQVSIGLDQTRLGRPVRNVRVHLQGTYTVLPPNVGGSVVVAINGETLAQWPTDGAGVIDRWVDVPDRLLQRYTNLGVAIDITGDVGRCGEFQPITLTIDGETAVESGRAEPPVRAGFQSFPQALMPRFDIGIGPNAFDDTRRAVAVLVGLQRLSALPMDASVMPLQQAIDSPLPALLIASDGGLDQRITLPVSANDSGELKVVGVDGPTDETTLTLDPGQRFGSLQTVFDGKRALLVATSNGAPGRLDALLAWLDSAPNRWSRLSGDAILAPAGREPVAIGVAAAQEPEAVAERRDHLPYWFSGAGLAAIVVVGAAMIWWHRRRRTPGS